MVKRVGSSSFCLIWEWNKDKVSTRKIYTEMQTQDEVTIAYLMYNEFWCVCQLAHKFHSTHSTLLPPS